MIFAPGALLGNQPETILGRLGGHLGRLEAMVGVLGALWCFLVLLKAQFSALGAPLMALLVRGGVV
eukprot:6598726-Pyramimonas_sp.AAC.1